MWDGMKSLISFILGVILLPMGLIPLLAQWGVIGFSLPGFLTGLISSVILWIIAGSGFYLLIESFMEGLDEPHAKLILVVGMIVLALGLTQLFGVLPFSIPTLIFNIIFIIEGLLMVIGAWNM